MKEIQRNMLLKIRTNDNHVVDIDEKDLMISNLISMVAQSIHDVNEPEEIPLYNVSYSLLLKTLEYTRHYRREPMRTISKPLFQNKLGVQQWYVDYISLLEKQTLFDLLSVSTYLDIEPLQELICAYFATLITGTEFNELKEIFGFHYE